MSISLEGLDSLLGKMDATKNILSNPKPILESAADNIENDTINAVNNQKSPDNPVGVKNSGSWQPFKHSNGFDPPQMDTRFFKNKVEVDIPKKKYIYQHYGTKASKITPKNAKVLRFKIGSKVVYSKFANSEGLPPRPFLGYNNKSIDKVFSIITKIWSE